MKQERFPEISECFVPLFLKDKMLICFLSGALQLRSGKGSCVVKAEIHL